MKKLSRRSFLAAVGAGSVATAAALAGCSSESASSTATSTATSTSTAASSEAAEEQIVLKWYTQSDEAANERYKWQEIADNFHAAHPNVTVEVASLVATSSSADYLAKVDLMFASDEQIDIIDFSGNDQILGKVQSGLLTPLDEFAAELGVDIPGTYTGVAPIDGHYYSLPNSNALYLVFINKDLLDEAGLPVPPVDWTWADYYEYAKALTKGEGANKTYGSLLFTWADFFMMGTLSVLKNNVIYNEDGRANFDDPAFATWFQQIYDMSYVDGCNMPYMDVKTQNLAYRNVFFNGQAAMLPMGSWFLSDLKATETYPHTFETTFAALPRFDENAPSGVTINTAFGGGFTINANCKHPKEAFEFLNYLTTEGFDISKSYLSPWKEGDHEGIAAAIMGEDDSLYDLEAYLDIVNNPDLTYNDRTVARTSDAEIYNILLEEIEIFLTDGQSLDQAIDNMQTRANAVIDKNA